jgi:fucose 4-O-acetylase-like acetyltransferase
MTVSNTRTTERGPVAAGRDRWLTALRGVSMALVVCTHILFTTPTFADGRAFLASNTFTGIAGVAIWGLAWVIPGFFFSSGAVMLRSARGPAKDYVKRRVPQLLVPYYVYVALVLPIQYLVLKPAGVCPDFRFREAITWIFPLHVDCLGLAQGPFWFLMVFIPVMIAMPLLARIYDSKARFVFPIVMVVAFALFDRLFYRSQAAGWTPLPDPRDGFVDNLGNGTFSGTSLAIYGGYILVFWAVVAYLGFFYADGYLQRMQRRTMLAVAGACIAVTVVLVAFTEYPLTVFGYTWTVPGADGPGPGNQFPPTILFLTAAAGTILVFLAVRQWIVDLSETDVLRSAVDWLADRSLLILIWHLTLYEFVVWALYLLGWWDTVLKVPAVIRQPLFVALLFAAMVPFLATIDRLDEGVKNRLFPYLRPKLPPRPSARSTEPDSTATKET